MEDIYKLWCDTLQSAGIKPLGDDTCCQLLAILYVFGGERAEFTLATKLRTDIRYAQKRLNLLGGEMPDPELVPVLNRYVGQLAPKGIEGEWFKPQWAVELMSRYGIKL